MIYADNANHLGMEAKRVDAQRLDDAFVDIHELEEASNLTESLGRWPPWPCHSYFCARLASGCCAEVVYIGRPADR